MIILKIDLVIHKNFLTMISISLFYSCEKVFAQKKYTNYKEKFNETSSPEKEYFYRYQIMEDITDADYAYVKRVYLDFLKKTVGDSHDLYVQKDTLLRADVYENFRNMFL